LFSDAEKQAIQRSWRLVVPIAETAADLFYKRLFETHPDYRRFFPSDMSAQKRKLVRMLAFIVKSMEWSDAQWREEVDPSEDLMLVVLAMGRRHTDLYKIPNESYAPVGEALIWTLDYALGDAFTPETRAAWERLYSVVAQTMRMGAMSAADEENALPADAKVAEHNGEAALLAQMADVGIDDARLGLPEEQS
jgi:hemoglobin-like flavoprotein